MRQRNIGDRQQIYINNICLKGVISGISRVESGEMKGTLEAYILDEYGDTQDFWFPDDGIADEQAERRRSRSMMPPEYVYKRGRDFDWTLYGESVEYQKKIANAFVMRFEDFRREGRGVYISSQTKGSGKTLLACCLANEIIQSRDLAVKFIGITEYIELLKGKSEQEKDVVKGILESGLLILDDIGAEASEKEWISNAVFRLVDYRDKHMLPTIYTSNYEMEKLPGDDRIVNRIIGHSIPLPMPEVSVRNIKAKEKTGAFLKSVLSESNGDAFSGKE